MTKFMGESEKEEEEEEEEYRKGVVLAVPEGVVKEPTPMVASLAAGVRQ